MTGKRARAARVAPAGQAQQQPAKGDTVPVETRLQRLGLIPESAPTAPGSGQGAAE
ncbi:hypothetical protein AMIS_20750 [Actinoplanes missouriensis 431]|uniref:Uncharacterized protein n=1 Tax=Actinoplanes missouriensis (strain ATCC 14538 / DSM 43046 / CBS 188.64 / JCM 3121 / NBRC 102363 / NCIMB 12654 / NRRL B-3342 / UNCC 431) TaxID=512565 RepID=I0H2Q8_ACTM4|nr:hypothetical protein [Actinoplanes missouriensis]BAL87295.1 hypothetical protein AMIS_20750 [Actinoplanes missouriensis 431]